MFRRSWARPTGTRVTAPAPRTATKSTPDSTPTIVDDAAHGGAFASHAHKEWYTEWWYFNVRDPKTGIAMLAMFDVSPFGLGLGTVCAMVFPKDGTPCDAKGIFPPSEVKTS